MFIKRSRPPLVVSVNKVWDYAPHNAFTDLCHHQGRFYLTFREAAEHQSGSLGTIRILSSVDGVYWQPHELLELEGVDLRDPKISVMPDGRLHLMVGASLWDSEGRVTHNMTMVAFSDNLLKFSTFKTIEYPTVWLWRMTWFQGVGYTAGYDIKGPEWTCALYKTEDGHKFEKVTTFELNEDPNEATIRFTTEGEMKVLVRRSGHWNSHAIFGNAWPPYTEFEWLDTGYSIGGPNFLWSTGDKKWFSGRLLYGTPWGLFAKTALLAMDDGYFHRELFLPSFGDTSYPGMVLHDNYLWVSYYSSHEKKTAIYLAKILLN